MRKQSPRRRWFKQEKKGIITIISIISNIIHVYNMHMFKSYKDEILTCRFNLRESVRFLVQKHVLQEKLSHPVEVEFR